MKRVISIVLLLFFFIQNISAQQISLIAPEDAFHSKIEQKDDFIFFNIDMPEGVYLLDDNFNFEVLTPKKLNFSENIQKTNPSLYKEQKVYFEYFEAVLPIDILRANNIQGKTTVRFSYQGCANGGITCYPPMSKTLTIDIENTSFNTSSEHGKIASMFLNSSVWAVLISFFGFGLLLSLTPCVFPMIPILSSVIAQNSKDSMSSKKGFLLSLVYVLSASFTYALAGVLAGIFGANLQVALQNVWVISLFSLLFVILAFSMFGAYKIDIPSSLKTKLSKFSNGKSGIFGVVIMGVLSALIVGPCVAAPLAGALLYISHTANALLGGSALFVMSLGMGVPLLVIGASAGKFLPKPGIWMNRVMNFFGIVMLFMAVWMLSRIIPPNISLILYGVLTIGTALFFGFFSESKNRILKTIWAIILIYGVVIFIGGIAGATSPLNPLQNFTSNKVVSNDENYIHVKSLDEFMKIVKSSQKPVMAKFTATWCSICKEFEAKTLSKNSVKEKLEEFTLVSIDVTKNNDNDKELLKRYNLYGPPAIIFYKNGVELENLQIVGFKNENEFLEYLAKVINE